MSLMHIFGFTKLFSEGFTTLSWFSCQEKGRQVVCIYREMCERFRNLGLASSLDERFRDVE